jgi:hypothetical protein
MDNVLPKPPADLVSGVSSAEPMSRTTWRDHADPEMIRLVGYVRAHWRCPPPSVPLAEEPCWECLLARADQHGVLPLLYHQMAVQDGDDIPSHIRTSFKTAFHGRFQNTLLLTQEWLALLDLLDQHRLRVVSFKGPVLAGWAYGNLKYRLFSDLDLYVRIEGVPTVSTLLHAAGFVAVSPQPGEGRRHRIPAWLRARFWGNAQGYVRDQGQPQQVCVDLHWGLTPRYLGYSLDLDRWEQRLQTVTVQGRPVVTFSPEDTVLLLALHGMKHGWHQLGMVCDLAALLTTCPGLDWDVVQEQARQIKGQRMLLLALFLAQDLLEVAPPTPLRNPPSDVLALARLVYQWHLVPTTYRARTWYTYQFNLAVRDRMREGVMPGLYHTLRGLGLFKQRSP